MTPWIDPWLIELIVVQRSHDGTARSAPTRDVQRGLLLRLRRGVYVERVAFEAMNAEEQHVVRMRALAAVADRPVVFSHFSAAVAQALPVLSTRLGRLHVTVDAHSSRSRDDVTGHLLPLTDDEVEVVGGLRVTGAPRTVVDIAGAAPFDEGVMVADALLLRGLPRGLLHAAIDAAGPRRAIRRADDVVGFAHPGGESAAESRSRCTLLQLGVEPPVLQHRIVLLDGPEVFLDILFPSVHVGGEVDGAVKVLGAANEEDARRVVLREKRREDALRLQLTGLARWGWAESGSAQRLRPVLQRVGVLPSSPRATLADYTAEARSARPRRRLLYG